MNKFNLALGLSLSLALLTACGGGGSDDNDGDTGGTDNGDSTDNGGSTAGGVPVAKLTCSESVTGVGRTFKMESGFEGNIEYDCKFPTAQNPDGLQYKLTSGTQSPLVIENIQKKTYMNGKCDDGSHGSGTITSDYQTGKVDWAFSSSEGSYSCTATFKSPLAVEFTDHESMVTILGSWGQDPDLSDKAESGLLTTTCPQDDDDSDTGEVDFDDTACSETFLENYVITDGDGKIHKISRKTTY